MPELAELDSIADELYGLRPDEFSAVRDEKIRQAKADKHADLAKELARLRKPTHSAWLVNLLWRDQREVMEQLFDLAAEMTRAQAEVAGAELRQLTAQRRQIESALLRRAEALAREAGVEVSASTTREAQETLSAALAQPDVADEVRSGRLVKPAAYAGFGAVVTPSARPASAPSPKPAEPKAKGASNVIELQAARAKQKREAARQRVVEARAALKAEAATLAEHARDADAAHEHAQKLRGRLEELREEVSRLQAEVTAAERKAVAARQQHEQADKKHGAAERALEQAEQALDELP